MFDHGTDASLSWCHMALVLVVAVIVASVAIGIMVCVALIIIHIGELSW